ncbi:MAG: pantoate--beta-alanine ligase [Candidatus Gygaella obscura]|nr:pantoate--beta-alanine ligase [Candidatus Gygaella obscura]
MQLIKKVSLIQKKISLLKLKGKSIGFIPTMGCFHKGHLSLCAQSAKDNDITVVSIFVNPKQFGPKEDFKKYPRALKRDLSLARKSGVDFVFYPGEDEIYDKSHLTYVEVDKLSNILCGKVRLGHFKGVTTIVLKLLNIVQPDIFYLGQKDYQQYVIIKKMLEDLNLSIRLKLMPTVREASGLAMSSRNKYLSKKNRERATIIYRALQRSKTLVKLNEVNPTVIKKFIVDTISKHMDVEYVEILDVSLSPVNKITGKVLFVVAARIAGVRLIDNMII